ncbi:LysR family transcriptional regulator [Rhodobacteraceae bacterium NNCM2]|nr:LysR family transcriptional regulator [Coraliihabitans acroporae]
MIEDYRNLAVFVAVADAGSLSAAGRRLKLSTSVVSHHLSRLEAKQGVTLFFRSTRSMSLTPEGRAALPAARRMVAAGEEALDTLGATAEEPVGALRITMPAFGEEMRLREKLWEFAKRHPMVAISLHSSDAPADLIREGFDLAIRLGTLSDSSLKSRRIGGFGRVLVGSPGYLATRPPVETVEDVVECDFIGVSTISDKMTLQSENTTVTVEPENIRLEVDTIASAKSAVMAGLGLRALPTSEVEAELTSGNLVRVLPDWSLPVLGIYAVWPDSGPQKALTRRLIDFFLADKVALSP